MLRVSSFALACAFAFCALASCATDDPAGPASIAPRISWLGPEPGVPTGVETIRVTVSGGAEPVVAEYAVSGLADVDFDGRGEATLRGLAIGVRLHLRVEGLDAGGAVTHVGQANLTLTARERREIELRMAPVAVATSLDGPAVGGLAMASVSRLRDGRILVAGGLQSIDAVADGESCPGSVGVAGPDLKCFVGVATSRLWVFDPTSLRFTVLTARLTYPRALHTATVLEDGRVLIAGGASAPLLIFRRQATGPNAGWRLDFGSESLGSTPVEVFDPQSDSGDAIARGEITSELLLASSHVGGAASLLPGDDSSVLLMGGIGDLSTFELFSTTDSVLSRAASSMPVMSSGTESRALITLGDPASALFVLGNALAVSSPDDLVRRWAAGEGAGVLFATALTTTDAAPQQLFGAGRSTCSFESGHGVSLGWYGVPCTPGTSTSIFPGEGAFEMCAPALDRNATLSYEGGAVRVVRTPALAAHAFASSTVLDDGSCVVVGGYGDLEWADERSIEIVKTVRDSAGRAGIDRFGRAGWSRGFSAAASLGENGVLIVGGLAVDPDAGTTQLTAPAEILFFGR